MTEQGILLFGGGGFVGQVIQSRLNATKRQVYTIQRDNHHNIERALDECSTIIHLASATTPSASALHPALELDNVIPTLHLLESLQAHQQKHLIFLSSGGALYGNPDQLPVDENQVITPLSYYGAGKVAIEAFLQVLRQQLAVTILRPSNAYGPRQPLRKGFGIIRHILEHACQNTVLTIWGDGQHQRDFIYIDDLVNACVQLIEQPKDTGTYHVGCGRGYTLNEVIALAKKISGVNFPVEYQPAVNTDVKNIVLDISRIKSISNWAPQIDLEEGMRRTWQWMKHQ